MPIIYLSPSTQDWNHFVNGGTEEYYMNLIADAMEPYLLSSGIRWVRNTPDMTAASSIAQSNHGNYDLHLALHSNAAPEGEAGCVRARRSTTTRRAPPGNGRPTSSRRTSRRSTPTPGWSRRSRPPGSARSPRRARPAC